MFKKDRKRNFQDIHSHNNIFKESIDYQFPIFKNNKKQKNHHKGDWCKGRQRIKRKHLESYG